MNLRAAALKGGAFLAARHAMSLVIHLVGVALLTRAVGPSHYGIYVGALGVQTYLYNVGQSGLVVYLIRHGGELDAADFDQAFTLLALIGVVLAVTVFFLLPVVEARIGIASFAEVGRVLIGVLPIQLLGLVPMGRLERALNYKAIAPAELAGYVMFYLVALPLAHSGIGEWAPVAGFWAQQLLLAGMLYRIARYRPHFRWDAHRVREMLSYGIRYSGANWIWQTRELVNPLIVGRFLGPTSVAYVALTVRLVEALSFLKGVGWRVSLAVLGQIQSDAHRMARAASDAMRLQVLVLGAVLTGFGLVSHWAIPRLLGPEWTMVTSIYPFVALSYLTHSIFQMEVAMLGVVGMNRQVAVFHLTHLALFAGAALVLVPRLGPVGYGWSEVVALAGYLVLHVQVSQALEAPEYTLTGVWWAAFVSLIFSRQLGWFCLVIPIAALLWPGTTRALGNYATSLVKLRYAD